MGPRIAAVERKDGEPVCERCVVAASPVTRMRGLLGRTDLPAGEGVLLRPAGSIHTYFMRFAIDVVFLDRNFKVVSIVEHLRPWNTARRRGAKAVLELRAGEAKRRRLEVGQELSLGR